MSKREKLRIIKKIEKSTIIERNIYIISTLFLLSTIIINILNIIYYPYIINGIVLETNILFVSFCIYLLLKKQKQNNKLKTKKLNLKLKYFPEK